MWDLIFYLVNTRPLLMPRQMLTCMLRPIEAGLTRSYTVLPLLPLQWHFPSSLWVFPFNMLQHLRTHLRSAANSLAVLWVLTSFLCCHSTTETWQCRSFNEELPEDHVAGTLLVGGPMRKIKIPVQELRLKNEMLGLIREAGGGGGVYAGPYVICFAHMYLRYSRRSLPWDI